MKRYSRRRYYRKHDEIREKERVRNREPERRVSNYADIERRKQRHPERHRARQALNNAIRSGSVVRLPCRDCGNPRSQGHHHDYSKPFDVEWLCARCHGKEHRRSEEGLSVV